MQVFNLSCRIFCILKNSFDFILRKTFKLLIRSIQDDVTVTDDTRLRAIVPTAKFLLDQKANIILASHFGRP